MNHKRHKSSWQEEFGITLINLTGPNKRLGQKSLAPLKCLWNVRQGAVVEWALLR